MRKQIPQEIQFKRQKKKKEERKYWRDIEHLNT